MSITVEERFKSLITSLGENNSVERRYIVRGTESDVDATLALQSEAPLTYNGMQRGQIDIEPVGEDLWFGVVRYQLKLNNPPAGTTVLSFETGGGTQHVTQSRKTIARHAPPGKIAPDFKGAIAVVDGRPEGVDAHMPIFNLRVEGILPAATVSAAYIRTLFELTATTNDAQFYGYQPGELLLLGVSGSRRSDEDWRLQFAFAGSPNAQNLAVGDIQGIAKKGWEYLWAYYEQSEDAAAKVIVTKPLAAYVEQLYLEKDFTRLGIAI